MNEGAIKVVQIGRGGPDGRALRAVLAYQCGTTGGGILSIPADLADPVFLERFIAAGLVKIPPDLRRMGDQNGAPVSLRRGALFELLAFGIEPGEVLTYALRWSGDSGVSARLAQWSPHIAAESAEHLQNAALVVRRWHDFPLVMPFARGGIAQGRMIGTVQGRHLKPVPTFLAEFWQSPIAPRHVRGLGALADTLNLMSTALTQVAAIQKHSIGRPACENERGFVREWEKFIALKEEFIVDASGERQVLEIPRAGTRMKNSSGRHRTLDRQGAQIFNTVFQKSITAASFRRYRLASEPPRK